MTRRNSDLRERPARVMRLTRTEIGTWFNRTVLRYSAGRWDFAQ